MNKYSSLLVHLYPTKKTKCWEYSRHYFLCGLQTVSVVLNFTELKRLVRKKQASLFAHLYLTKKTKCCEYVHNNLQITNMPNRLVRFITLDRKNLPGTNTLACWSICILPWGHMHNNLQITNMPNWFVCFIT
jgi:hypothetical protein